MKKRWICVSLLLAVLCVLVCCGRQETGGGCPSDEFSDDSISEKKTEKMEEEIISGKDEVFTISKDAPYSFRVIRGEFADETVIRAAIRVREALIGATGAQISISDDWLAKGESGDPDAYEILVGVTNREESGEIPEAGTFVIRAVNHKIVLLGSSDRLTVNAADRFIEDYVSGQDKSVTIPQALCTVVMGEAGLAGCIAPGGAYEFSLKALGTVSAVGDCKYVQGGCTDGTYYYTSLISVDANDQNNNHVILLKYDMSNWTVAARKEGLLLCHCNDMCYNPDTGFLYVANNTPQNKKVTVIDPETLEIRDEIMLTENIYSIGYDTVRKRYVVGISGCENLAILDSDFKVTGRISGVVTGYTKQGVECDDTYIYMLYHKVNTIMIYDWSGNFITRIDLTGKMASGEPEHLALTGDTFVLGTNGSKIIYRMTLNNKVDTQ